MAETKAGPIRGDIAALADVAIHTKGGSVTATLKKSLRERLGNFSEHLMGAALQFASGESVLLLASVAETLRIRKVSGNRYEITLEHAGEKEVDPVTAAFLRLKSDQFEKGMLRLSAPMSADDWRRESEADFAGVADALNEVPAVKTAS